MLADRAAAGATITYAGLVEEVPELAPLRDRGRLGAVLRDIAIAEDEAGRGLLTAVVVRSRGGALPGAGFFALAAGRGRDTADRRRCWEAERDRVFAAHRRA